MRTKTQQRSSTVIIGKQSDAAIADGWMAQIAGLFSRPLIVSLFLAMVTLWVYWPARQFDFLSYDDQDYFTQNSHVQNGVTWSGVRWAFTSGEAANWHPLTWLSLMLDSDIFGDQPAGPHLVNLLFHCANTMLVFVLFRRLTAAHWTSAFVAALFALHPLHVESVAWIAERKDLLCAFFALLTLLAYAGEVTHDECRVTPQTRNAGRASLLVHRLSLVFFALALMSKPMAVTLPFVLLLLDFWPLQRFNASTIQRLAMEKIPFFALGVAASVVTFIVQKKGDAVETLATFPMGVRIENAFVSYARYLGKTIWPAALATPYPHPGHWPGPTVALCGLLFVALCVVAFWGIRKFPFVFTGWFWFAGMLVPVIGLVQVGMQAMADRYTYLPAVGLFVILAWGGASVAAHRPYLKSVFVLAALFLAGACAVCTRCQLAYWQNDGLLFGHALAVTENNYVARINLGTWFSKNGRTAEALEQYDLALKMQPADPLALYDLANAFAQLGRTDDAIALYRRALELAPGRADALNNLGCALMSQNRLPEAITNFEAALRVQPDLAAAENDLATALFRQGKFEAAAKHFYAAIRLEPDNALFYANLGDTMKRAGKLDAAVECYQQALKLKPNDEDFAAKLNSVRR